MYKRQSLKAFSTAHPGMGSPRWRSLAGWWKSWKSTRCSAMGAQLYRPPTLCTSRVMTREVHSVGGRYNCAPIAEHLVLFQLFHQPASDLHRGIPSRDERLKMPSKTCAIRVSILRRTPISYPFVAPSRALAGTRTASRYTSITHGRYAHISLPEETGTPTTSGGRITREEIRTPR